MHKKNYFFQILFIFLSCSSRIFAQQKILSVEDYYTLVKNNHPVSKQASLLTNIASSQNMNARGALDPYLYGYYDNKTFDKKNYYDGVETGIKLPTYYGIDFKAGYQTASGKYLNPEEITPTGGLAFAGVSVPLGQGLLIDKRRAAIQQAQFLKNINDAEKIDVINNLLFDALVVYYEWQLAKNQVDILEQFLTLQTVRFEGVKNNFKFGEQPEIDTVETLIQLQTIQMSLLKTKVEFTNKSLELSTYLWDTNNLPITLSENTIPTNLDSLTILNNMENSAKINIENVVENHPNIVEYKYKILQYNIDRKLYTDKLKPKLNVNYNFLSSAVNLNTSQLNSYYLSNNYKVGIEFAMPLFLRAERSNIAFAKLKIKNAELGLSQKQFVLKNKIQAYQNEYNNLILQLNIFNKTVANYKRMLTAEFSKFDIGESSVFLVNSRENKLIEAQQKLCELKMKIQKTEAALNWAKAKLPNGLR